MNLLITTQKVDKNDPILGFFHGWLKEFSKYFNKVTVICLEKGEYELPQNIEIVSLGKEHGVSKIKYVFNFYEYIYKKRKDYDKVFVHMNPEYVVLGGVFWKYIKKDIYLWYTHKNVNLWLKIATFLSKGIFTASKQSFNIDTPKLFVLGHGVDLNQFSGIAKERGENINLLHVGRITRIKNCEVLIRAGEILSKKFHNLKIIFVGSPVTKEDFVYKEELENLTRLMSLDHIVSFVGSVPNHEIKKYYAKANLTINMTPTGGVDKTVLESMASSVIALSSNESFLPYFGKFDSILYFNFGDYKDLAYKVDHLLDYRVDVNSISVYLRNKVEEMSDLEKLILKISNILTSND
jgi:glycosyltransferase involved in cell wall biosynthesis